jgi:hypothetical protein
MISGLILAAVLVTQAPGRLTVEERRAYLEKQGGVVPRETARQKAQARRYDAWNRRYAGGDPRRMRFTIWSGVRFARQHPELNPQFRRP